MPRSIVAKRLTPLLAAMASIVFSWSTSAVAQNVPAVASGSAAASASTAMRAAAQPSDAALVQRIAAQLGAHPIVQSAYTQTQTRAALRRPLTSSGTLLFARDSGVVWTVERPFQAVYAITDRGVRQVKEAASDAGAASGAIATSGPSGQSKDGAGVTTAANAKAPPAAAAQVSRMMRAMLGGDLSALYSQFDVSAQGTVTRWRLRLLPNQPQIATAVRQVDLEGGDFVTSLDIVQANGDTLQWTFDGAHPLATLPEREQTWLTAK